MSAAPELMACTRAAEAQTVAAAAAAAEALFHTPAASSAVQVHQEDQKQSTLLARDVLPRFQTEDSSHCSSYH
jgi:hypothetical protein